MWDFPVCTADEMRAADREAIEGRGIPSLVLMENAGRGVVEGIQRVCPDWSQRRYLIACGIGNNGGDGLVVARHLRQRGVPGVFPVVLGAREKMRGDAAWNLNLYEAQFGPVPQVTDMDQWWRFVEEHPGCLDVVVDAVFGTGLHRPLEGFYAAWVTAVSQLPRVLRISVDVPSGLNADTGTLIGPAFRAHYTFTMAAPKRCLVFPPACEYAGSWFVVTIGTPVEVLDRASSLRWPREELLAHWLTPRVLDSHKGQYGRILVIGGAPGRLGAAAMAGLSALKIGAGLVTVAVPRSCWTSLMASLNELMTLGVPDQDGVWCPASMDALRDVLPGMDVVVLGPGLGTHPETVRFLGIFLDAWQGPLVVDADGLNILALHPEWLERLPEQTILTPHPGEMARLIGSQTRDVQARRVDVARKFAEDFEVVLVLKGFRTLVARPDGRVYINPTGNPGMASGGMGDILSGFIGGLMGQIRDAFPAALLGVYLHGRAGDLARDRVGELSLTATDLWDTVGDAIQKLRTYTRLWHL